MNSPFPGMDPYLERRWSSVHSQLVVGATRVLNITLPGELVACPEERLEITSDEDREYATTVVSDTAVIDFAGRIEPGSNAITAPFKLLVEPEPANERYVKILAGGDRLITVIEFISPANKIGKGMEKYLRKRRELLNAGVHVVEVDLVRRGSWRELLRPHICPKEAIAEYRSVIRTGGHSEAAYLYPWPLRSALRPVPIPLRSDDAPIQLDVQKLLDDLYAGNRYWKTIDYSEATSPPLQKEHQAWADELLRDAGKRS